MYKSQGCWSIHVFNKAFIQVFLFATYSTATCLCFNCLIAAVNTLLCYYDDFERLFNINFMAIHKLLDEAY